MKLYEDIWSAWISCTSAEIFFSHRWHHKCLRNTIDLLLFYREYFYGFLGSDLWKRQKKKTFISQHTSIYKVPRHFEVLWSFNLYIL